MATLLGKSTRGTLPQIFGVHRQAPPIALR
jgi:hypothetical protein